MTRPARAPARARRIACEHDSHAIPRARLPRERTRKNMTRKITILLPDDAPAPSLDLLQAAVGGYVEPVDRFLPATVSSGTDPHEPVVVAYANEEGAIKGLPPNVPGSIAVRWPLDRAEPIRGPVVVLEGWERGHFTGEFDED